MHVICLCLSPVVKELPLCLCVRKGGVYVLIDL